MSKPSSIGKSDQMRGWSPIVTATTEQAEMFDTRKDSDWLNPISVSSLQRAVKSRKKTVILNGDEFTISYGHMFNTGPRAVTEPYECAKLKRKDGSYAPFGYVSVDKILRFKFEDGLK